MSVIRFFITRPVFTTVISLIITIIGLFFFTKLPLLHMPRYFEPKLTISTYLAGADAAYMEKEVTNKIERKIKNLKHLTSYSSATSMGFSSIELVFDEDADIEIALNDTRSALSELVQVWPKDMQLPVVGKVAKNDRDSMRIALTSEKLNALDLDKIVMNQIKPSLERLGTVGEVGIFGRQFCEISINLENLDLFKHQISPDEIESKIKNYSRSFPLGNANLGARKYVLQMNSIISSLEDLKNVVIKKHENTLVRLKDIADVKFSPSKIYNTLYCNGKRGLGIFIKKATSSNGILLSSQVKKSISQLSKDLGDLVKFEIVYDESLGLIEAIKSVGKSIVEAIVLVSLIVFLFLGSLRLSFIPIITIPISVIGTFFIMHLLNFSINMFSLLAISLSIGMIVDDAIVILENISRHIKLGKSRLQASIDATSEIASAVVSMTITLAAVFIPVGFMKGEQGRQFTEFAWTLASCVGVSGIVALTLSPMLTYKFISNKETDNKKAFFLEKIHIKLENFYEFSLKACLRRKFLVFFSCIMVFVGVFFAVKRIEKAFLPSEDIGVVFVAYHFPNGYSVFECEKTASNVEKFLSECKEIKHYITPIWDGGASTFIILKDWSLRKKSQFQISRELNEKMQTIREASIFCFSPMGGGERKSGIQLSFMIKSKMELEEMNKNIEPLIVKLKHLDIASYINSNFSKSQPTINISPDFTKINFYNVDLNRVASSIQYLGLEHKLQDLWIGDSSYAVVMKLKNNYNKNITELLKSILVKSNSNDFIPLASLIKIELNSAVGTYNHYNGDKSIEITINLNKNIHLLKAISEVKNVFSKTMDPTKFSLEFTGDAKKMDETESRMVIVFLFAMLLIFLVLAAQFESFKDSLLILLSVPFSTIGGIIGLWAFSETLNMYSYIGFIALIGLITKNAIMIIEFANQLREQHKSVGIAIIEAAKIRLKPILMTSFSTILGAVPLIFSTGAGAGANHSLGMVIVFGMLLGTVFSLVVVPVLYHGVKKDKI